MKVLSTQVYTTQVDLTGGNTIVLPKTDDIVGGCIINDAELLIEAGTFSSTVKFLILQNGNVTQGANRYLIATATQSMKPYGAMMVVADKGHNPINYFEGQNVYLVAGGAEITGKKAFLTINYSRVELTAAEILAVRTD